MPARQTTPPSSPACCQHPPFACAFAREWGCARGGWGVETDVYTPLPLFLCSPHLSVQLGNPGRRTKGLSPPFLLITAPAHAMNRTASAGASPPVRPLCALPPCAPPLSAPPPPSLPHLHAAATHNEGQRGDGRLREGARSGAVRSGARSGDAQRGGTQRGRAEGGRRTEGGAEGGS